MRKTRDNLTQKRLKEVVSYDPDTGVFIRISTNSRKIKAGCIAGGINAIGYRVILIDGDIHLAHRLAWLYVTGSYPKYDIDHRNGNRSDNIFSNLRDAKTSDNLCNRGAQKNNTSGYKNVSWCRMMNKWHVRLTKNKKQFLIGYFEDIEEANNAAILAREKHHKEFSIEKMAA